MSDLTMAMFTPAIVEGMVIDYREVHKNCGGGDCTHDYSQDADFQAYLNTLEKCKPVLDLIMAIAVTALEHDDPRSVAAAVSWGIFEGWKCARRALEVEALERLTKEDIT